MDNKAWKQMIDAYGVQTPCYIFDEDELKERVEQIRQLLAESGTKLCYAIKANPFLLPVFDAQMERYEVCSRGELEICRHYKIAGEKIIFSGVVKSDEDIRAALAYPVDTVTVESWRQWELLKACMADTQRTVKVLLRLTSGAQFGMRAEEIHSIIEETETVPQIFYLGIHYFAGTQRKGEKYEKELSMLCDFCGILQEKYGKETAVLEYGPGLPVPYFAGEDVNDCLQSVGSLSAYLKSRTYPFSVTVELGRYIAASCGHYITKVMDVKRVEDRNYCLVDGGIHQVSYYGQNMAMRMPAIRQLSGEEREDEPKDYMLCGSLCTFADILARGLSLKGIQPGDLLMFDRTGAYSVTEPGYLFLSHDLPFIYTYSREEGVVLAREGMPSWKWNVSSF